MPRRSSSLDSRGGSFPLRRSSSSASSAVKMSGKQRIVPELAALMIYTAGVKYRGFSKLVEYKAEEMFSVSEKVGTKILRATPLDFIKHNRVHLSRVYPNGTRLTSTNYLPHHFWAMGAQLVALNWQTCGECGIVQWHLSDAPLSWNTHWTVDIGFAFNAAMFARNGRSGYILKPNALRSRNKELLAQKERHILHLTVSRPSRLRLYWLSLADLSRTSIRSCRANPCRCRRTWTSTTANCTSKRLYTLQAWMRPRASAR